MELAAIKAQSEAARTFQKKSGRILFTLRMPPIAEAGESILQLLRAPPGKEAREATLAMLLDVVQTWEGATLGDFALTDDPAPVDFDRAACEQLFIERADVMGDVSQGLLEFLLERLKRVEAERKNSASTS